MSGKREIRKLFLSSVYGRLLGYAWQYKKYLLFGLIGMVLYSMTSTGLAILVKPFLDENLISHGERPYSWVIPGALFFILLARGIGSFMAIYYVEYVSNWVSKKLRSEMFAHLLQLPAAYFDTTARGVITSKLTFNVEKTMTVSAQTFTYLVRDTLTVIGLVSWLLYLEWKLSLIFMILFPVIGWLVMLSSKRLREASSCIQTTMGDVTDVIQQSVEADITIKVFNSQHSECMNFESRNEKNRKQRMKMLKIKAMNAPIAMFLAGMGLVLVMLFAMQGNYYQTISAGTLASFVTAALLLMRPVRNLVRINVMLQDGLAAAESIFRFLDESTEPVEGKAGKFKYRSDICFNDVSFTYQGSGHPALGNINLRVAYGETIALVGKSGAGKSTLTKLIPRLYEPTQGSIELNGNDIATIPLADLRRQIAYVPQRTVLSNETIAYNIACGRACETADIVTAARQAHALDFIAALPEGFDTVLRNNASIFSEGQKQRIAIAKAIFKDAPILIFDEATSALDIDSEEHIQAALEKIIENRTVFIIAHRFSTIKKADRIMVLDKGRIIEQGTRQELCRLDGIYARFYQKQGAHDLIN